MSLPGIGVDIIEIKRFADAERAEKRRFISNVFTSQETAYCRAFKDPAPHFAGTFAAKEAACKALGGIDAVTAFEIRRAKNGRPEIWKRRKKLLSLSVSISHAGEYAVAVCIAL